MTEAVRQGWQAWVSGADGQPEAFQRMLTGGAAQRRAIQEFFELSPLRVWGNQSLVPFDLFVASAADLSQVITAVWSWPQLQGPNTEPVVSLTSTSESWWNGDPSGRSNSAVVPISFADGDGWLDCDPTIRDAVLTFIGSFAG